MDVTYEYGEAEGRHVRSFLLRQAALFYLTWLALALTYDVLYPWMVNKAVADELVFKLIILPLVLFVFGFLLFRHSGGPQGRRNLSLNDEYVEITGPSYKDWIWWDKMSVQESPSHFLLRHERTICPVSEKCLRLIGT